MIDSPDSELARAYVEEYLRRRGHTMKTICKLPEGEAKRLWIEVSMYVAGKLAEVSTRSHFMRDIGGMGAPPM